MGTVTVACKLPGGLHLDLPGRDRVTVLGPAVPYGTPPHAVGGYALTPGVDEDFFMAWLTAHASMTFVKAHMIYCAAKTQDARAIAIEQKDIVTGLEALDPDKPGRGLERVGVT